MPRPHLTTVALALLLGACAFPGSPDGSGRPTLPTNDPGVQASPYVPPSPEVLAADLERRKVATPCLNRLGFKVFGSLLSQQPASNLALSPASLARALLMAYAGARGSTREAMANALGMPDQSETTLEDWAAATNPSLDKRGVAIQVCDSAWIRAGQPILPSFTEDLGRLFSAEVSPFSDSSEGTSKLQAWIKRASKNLLDGQGFQLTEEVRLALADVITFDGRWDEIFEKSLTQTRSFFSSPTESNPVPMMRRSGEFRYAEDEGYQVIRLPYQQSTYAMYVLLASDSAMASTPLDVDAFDRLAGKVTMNDGQILMPRFSFGQNSPLTDVLTASGLGLAFSEAADFTGIAPNLRLGQVGQEVRVDVDEEGTVAAAATVLTIVQTSVIVRPHPFFMEVNRPFYFAIRDDASKALLFLGRVTRP